jgi:hypothetical protein
MVVAVALQLWMQPVTYAGAGKGQFGASIKR